MTTKATNTSAQAATAERLVLASEPIFAGAVFSVVRAHLREPNGAEIVREVVTHVGGAGGLPVLPDGRVVLVKQYRHPAGRVLLEIPAGKLERGEDPAVCAAREIEEEIGWRAGRLELLTAFFPTPGFCAEELTIYLATELTPTAQALDADEFVEPVYVTLAKALHMVKTGEIVDSKTIIALLLAADRLSEAAKQGGEPAI